MVPFRDETVRSCFHSAVDGFVELVSAVPSGRFEEPALGAWSVRDLIGHASRALSTIESYHGKEANGPNLGGPVEYYLAITKLAPDAEARKQLDQSIAERGKRSGEELGPDPAAAIRELADRVVKLVDSSEDETPLASSMGPISLIEYLPTRTFELVVHSLDLAHALGVETPEVLKPALGESLVLAALLAATQDRAPQVLRALCGRGSLPESFSVV